MPTHVTKSSGSVEVVHASSSPVSFSELAVSTGGRYWGPGRLRRAASQARPLRPVGPQPSAPTKAPLQKLRGRTSFLLA